MGKDVLEIDRQINECYAMIDHFIQLKERGISYAVDEIAYWRKMLQYAKKYKRSIVNT